MVRYISINYLQQASDRMNTQTEPENGPLTKKIMRVLQCSCQKKWPVRTPEKVLGGRAKIQRSLNYNRHHV